MDELKRRILIVDSDAPIIRAYTRVFGRVLGDLVIVEGVQSADQALQRLAADRWDLVITDYLHDGIDGVLLTARIRHDPTLQDVPVLAVTAQSSELIHRGFLAAGAHRALLKPVGADELVQSVLDAIGAPRIDRNVALVRALQEESEVLDYKERLDLTSKSGRASLAKDLIAMANTAGGAIIIGVRDLGSNEFAHVGIPDALLHEYEQTRIARAAEAYVGPEVRFAAVTVRADGRSFVIVRVDHCEREVALARRDDAGAGLFRGRIYMRTPGAESREAVEPIQIQRLVERLARARLTDRANR